MQKSIYSRDQKRLAALLRELRLEAGFTQVELAKKLRSPQTFVSKYERGQRRLDLFELRTIGRLLGVSLGDLVRRFEDG